ncbi:hypothetical protein [Mycobacteroides abscessus]|uniref:hypothetical protein n=1 Tax=Mycobacteroides abscessus TaxID=36809 RepID=UPI001F3EA9B7|nr:hypothetical protein [Mycobacteroides abscessus]
MAPNPSSPPKKRPPSAVSDPSLFANGLRGYGPAKCKTRLPQCGIDDRGRKLYRLLDVAKAEHATRALARR